MEAARVDVTEPGALEEILRHVDAGEEVVLEREGRAVANVAPSPPPRSLAAFVEARRLAEPVDDEFERDLAEIARFTNRPATAGPWES